MFEPKEIYDVIDKDYSEKIYDYVTDINFDWHYMDDTTYEKTNDPRYSTPSFANLVYHQNNQNGPHLDFFLPLLHATCDAAGLKLDKLLRMRLGFLMNTKYPVPSLGYKYNTPHRDFDQEHYVACYYVNNADGDTVIFHETEPKPEGEKYRPLLKSTPLQGKVVVFNGWHYHASTCPMVTTKRIVMTMNFTASEING